MINCQVNVFEIYCLSTQGKIVTKTRYYQISLWFPR